MRYFLLIIALLGSVAFADEKEKAIVGEVVEISRSTILPNWGPTARAVTNNLSKKCYPIAAEALAQLDYFYQILEIAKAKVPMKDPIAAGQSVRKVELDKLKEDLAKAPHVNTGCPEKSLTPKEKK